MWEKIEDARRRKCDEIEVEDIDGEKVKVKIDAIGWYTEYY